MSRGEREPKHKKPDETTKVKVVKCMRRRGSLNASPRHTQTACEGGRDKRTREQEHAKKNKEECAPQNIAECVLRY